MCCLLYSLQITKVTGVWTRSRIMLRRHEVTGVWMRLCASMCVCVWVCVCVCSFRLWSVVDDSTCSCREGPWVDQVWIFLTSRVRFSASPLPSQGRQNGSATAQPIFSAYLIIACLCLLYLLDFWNIISNKSPISYYSSYYYHTPKICGWKNHCNE